MAPGIHPPCTPTSSCTPQRCHPTPPPCTQPEKCLERSSKKGSKPCPSAVSILATKSKLKCTDCGKCGGRTDTKNQKKVIKKYLQTKKKESKMKAEDSRIGTHQYEDYLKKKTGTARYADSCCQGKGHRGVLNAKKPPRTRGKKCVIL